MRNDIECHPSWRAGSDAFGRTFIQTVHAETEAWDVSVLEYQARGYWEVRFPDKAFRLSELQARLLVLLPNTEVVKMYAGREGEPDA